MANFLRVTVIFRRARVLLGFIALGLILSYGVYMAFGQIYVNDHARSIEPSEVKDLLDTETVVKLNLVAAGDAAIDAMDGKKYAYLTIKDLDKDDAHAVNKFHADKQEPEKGLWLCDKTGKTKFFCTMPEVEYLPVLACGGPEDLKKAPVPKSWTYLYGEKHFEVRGLEYNQSVTAIASLKTGDGKKSTTPILGLRLRPLAFCGYPIVTPYDLDSAEYKKAQGKELGIWLGLALFMVVPCTFLPVCILLGELIAYIGRSVKK
ncbi:MAG: hypothetical protein KIT34_07260 [Cyanobacteria bacterium TGS_CYA1]|nr:hypothetical protein [Cyanobacteria bacterium TGS_CYA1]